MSNPIIDSLQRAVEASPQDVPLRLHLAELLIGEGRGGEAVAHCATALLHSPDDAGARALMTRALAPASAPGGQAGPTSPGQAGEASPPTSSPSAAVGPTSPAAPTHLSPAASDPTGTSPTGTAPASTGPAGTQPPSAHTPAASAASAASAETPEFDWQQAEKDLGAGPAAPFVSGVPEAPGPAAPEPARPGALREPRHVPTEDADPARQDWEVEAPRTVLADVGGLADVKARLETSFLAPLRSPELRRLYGKSLRGGLLLYGPPGVGKTFIARAVAGEMGAGFLNIALTDILDPFIGNSEAQLHSVFRQARSNAPCVIFLDELDALGLKRSVMRGGGMRGVVNQLLQELDGIGSDNDGVYVLAATNTPWDIDPALRRPGRLDRAILVLPPDEPARAAILHTHLRNRPVEGIDLNHLARATEGLTGADLAHLCDTAAEKALLDSVRSGTPRMIQMPDLLAALTEVRPSTGPWFDTARNVVEYAELRAWMKAHKLL